MLCLNTQAYCVIKESLFNIAIVLSGNKPEHVCLGWSILPIFGQGNKRGSNAKSTIHVGGSVLVDTSSVRLPMYEGSSRILFTLMHPIAGK